MCLFVVLKCGSATAYYICVPSSLTSWCMTSSMLWSGPSSSVAGTSAPDSIRRWDVVCRSIYGKKKINRLQNVILHFINYFKIKSLLSIPVQEYHPKSIKPVQLQMSKL